MMRLSEHETPVALMMRQHSWTLESRTDSSSDHHITVHVTLCPPPGCLSGALHTCGATLESALLELQDAVRDHFVALIRYYRAEAKKAQGYENLYSALAVEFGRKVPKK